MAFSRFALTLKNLRVFEDVTLEFGPLTVLVGDNGSGKSTVLEALRILSRTTSRSFLAELDQIHGGVQRLARVQGQPVVLCLEAGDADDPKYWLRYELQLSSQRLGSVLMREHASVSERGRDKKGLGFLSTEAGVARLFRLVAPNAQARKWGSPALRVGLIALNSPAFRWLWRARPTGLDIGSAMTASTPVLRAAALV
ncbi:MAG: AAA family ATPase, partial [Deltaproteobacteria bacterium]|nr:AAA family ATPase [Deltaproteobacteria bacterium]